MSDTARQAAGHAGADADDDATLIARSLHAPECFGALFDRHAPAISRYIARRLGPDAADDLVAETFLVAFARRGRYDAARADARPWLYGIARYKFLDYLRRTRSSMHDIPIDEATDLVSHDDVEGVESSYDVDRLLERLSPKMQGAIRYVKLEGLSVNEAAARSGMSPSAVKVSVHRGLKALARLIAKETER